MYGLVPNGTTGQLPFTGWTPTLAPGTASANAGSANGAVFNNGITQFDAQFAHLLRVPGGRKLRALMRSVFLTLGIGTNINDTRTRVKALIGAPGGLQVLETFSSINRNSTAADVQALVAFIDRIVYPNPYPVDVSGNGGGGKLAYKGI